MGWLQALSRRIYILRLLRQMWLVQREDRDKFVTTCRPHVAAMLRHLYVAGRPRPDPFLILAREDEPESYVQCLLIEDGAAALCEAASGYYATRPDERRGLELTTHSRTVLRRLGFSIASAAGNHQLRFELNEETDLEELARIMLSAMFEVYGARPSTRLLCRSAEQEILLEIGREPAGAHLA